MPELLVASPEQDPDQIALRKSLIKDFYFGFRFSQGHAPLQEQLYGAIGRYYLETFSTDQLAEQLK